MCVKIGYQNNSKIIIILDWILTSLQLRPLVDGYQMRPMDALMTFLEL